MKINKGTWVPGGHAKYWLQSEYEGNTLGPAGLSFALKNKIIGL